MSRTLNTTIAMSLLACSMSACGTVPALQMHANTDTPPVGDTRPTVEQIVGHVNCELQDGANKAKLKADNYHITVTVLLQVDDQASLTPSLTETDGLRAFKGDTGTRVITIGGDYDGQRRRTFTTTYVIDASKWSDAPGVACAEKDKLYKLTGRLGLQEIVEDGLAAKRVDPAIILEPTTADPKSAPSFGSTVQFIVTRSVSSLGVAWTLSHWKGPGGMNGLFNGKRLDTDSIIITASPAGATKGDQKAAQEDIKKKSDTADDAHNKLKKAHDRVVELTTGQHIQSDLFQQQVTKAGNEENTAKAEAAKADQDLANAKASAAASDSANQAAAAAATSNSKDMLTTVLLQNLLSGH